ncbi:hypothetical protein [Rhizobium leguminosarum]|uniref:hypothetical protein n=1 Tax=Rhizobium leguminosarum TaxID=384 RepID=UPI0024A9C131|nr:hypothetical protein [Rhizobium leguminosarum]MDI5923531.1 hypothetical protein [Rhizobium leguminosarum]
MGAAFSILGFLAVTYVGWNLLTSLVVRSRRASKSKRTGIAFLVLTASTLISGILLENETRHKGFESTNDRQDAYNIKLLRVRREPFAHSEPDCFWPIPQNAGSSDCPSVTKVETMPVYAVSIAMRQNMVHTETA